MTNDNRILVLMPTTRDGERTRKALAGAGLQPEVCKDLEALCCEIQNGAGAALLTEESIVLDREERLQTVLSLQPAWSDFPLVVLARGGAQGAGLRELMNAMLVERPVKLRSLLSVIAAALRSRRHQYAIRDHLAERDRQAEALRAGEVRLRRMINVEGVGVLVWALPDGRLVGSNDFFLRMFGYTRAEIESGTLTWRDMTPPEYVAASEQQLARFAVTGRIGPYEKEYFRKDGTRAWMVFAGASLGDGSVVEYCIDVSDRKRAEEALQQADRRKDEFLATLAHELRNPLAPIRNGLEIMRLAAGDARQSEQARTMMERQVNHMVRLVDDLLDLSRISRGKIDLRKQPADLASILQQAIETSRPLIENAGHELTLAMPPAAVWVNADLTRMAQVFSNLLNNAAKYTEPGGRIQLTVARKCDEAVVSVRDSGIGIPASMLSRVFEMFTQVDRNLERRQSGLGVGLSIVKRLVEMHDGDITVDSEGTGKGSEFVVRLPALQGSAQSNNSALSATPASTGKRVLIVDDNVDAAVSLAKMLKMMGNETRIAHDGLEALKVAADYRPDLVMLDIGMPILNGYDTARRIREQPWSRSVKLVALTGWGQDEDRRKSAEAGFDSHIVKPIDVAELEKLLATDRMTEAV